MLAAAALLVSTFYSKTFSFALLKLDTHVPFITLGLYNFVESRKIDLYLLVEDVIAMLSFVGLTLYYYFDFLTTIFVHTFQCLLEIWNLYCSTVIAIIQYRTGVGITKMGPCTFQRQEIPT
ncbi:hypothetical protein ACJX0J_020952 [Zea mays]